MDISTTNSLFTASFKTVGYLFLFILFTLFIDSYFVSDIIPNAQLVTNIVMITGFMIVFFKSTSKIKEFMLYAVFAGYVGEYIFSIGLHMYTYRLGNVPHYVPPGHALVYIATIYFCKKSIIKLYKKQIEKIFTASVLLYGFLFLIFKEDVFGFVMTVLVIFFLRNKPRERLFYLTMYIVVAILEIVGTTYQCWQWPDTAWGVMPFLPSNNPPSGISLIYFLLDLGCLWLYKQRHRTAWARMKSMRLLKAE
jgi:hypothetical protein